MTFRVAFFGSDCLYSEIVLQALLGEPWRVCAVVLAGSGLPGVNEKKPVQALLPRHTAVAATDPNSLPVVSPYINHSILHTAWEHGVPLYAVNRMKAPETEGTIRMLNANVACVACFPRRIPQGLIKAPQRGFLNVHPSLLPAYRGPSPLFWQFRAGEANTGVTVHWIDNDFDTGPIAAQRTVRLPDGIPETDATGSIARAGARLLVEVLQRVAGGEIPYARQPPGGSYQPYPLPEDFAISTSWPARRIYNFMRGTVVWGFPYSLEIEGERLFLSDALSWSAYGVLDRPLVREGSEVVFQCTPGIIRARLAQVTDGAA